MRRKVLKLKKGLIKIEEEIKKKKPDLREQEKFFALLTNSLGVGFSLSLPIVFGAIFGSYLDSLFSTRPKLTLSFIFLGIVVSMVTIFKIVKEKGNATY